MIKIDLHKDRGLAGETLDAKKAKHLAELCIRELDSDKLRSTVEIFLVTKKTIFSINHDFRQVSRETDVLSFPQNFLPNAKEQVLGTIFISPEVANESRESCEELLIHGMLHLLGFDHEKNLKKWQAAEDKIMKIAPTIPQSGMSESRPKRREKEDQ